MQHHPTSTVSIDVSQGSSPDVVIMRVRGQLSIHNFFEFQEQTRKQPARILLIDLSEVPHLDSAALGSLVGLHVSRGNANQKYAIVGANERVRSLFEMTGISRLLLTYPTLSEAEAAVGRE